MALPAHTVGDFYIQSNFRSISGELKVRVWDVVALTHPSSVYSASFFFMNLSLLDMLHIWCLLPPSLEHSLQGGRMGFPVSRASGEAPVPAP